MAVPTVFPAYYPKYVSSTPAQQKRNEGSHNDNMICDRRYKKQRASNNSMQGDTFGSAICSTEPPGYLDSSPTLCTEPQGELVRSTNFLRSEILFSEIFGGLS